MEKIKLIPTGNTGKYRCTTKRAVLNTTTYFKKKYSDIELNKLLIGSILSNLELISRLPIDIEGKNVLIHCANNINKIIER